MYTFFVYDFSSFHPNNFRNTTSWKCFMKNEGVGSSLAELQSFPHSKIDVDPICCVLMSLPCFLHGLCMTRYIQVDRIRILVILVHGIKKQKTTVCLLLIFSTSRYQSRIDDGMLIDCTSDMLNVLEEVALKNHIVL